MLLYDFVFLELLSLLSLLEVVLNFFLFKLSGLFPVFNLSARIRSHIHHFLINMFHFLQTLGVGLPLLLVCQSPLMLNSLLDFVSFILSLSDVGLMDLGFKLLKFLQLLCFVHGFIQVLQVSSFLHCLDALHIFLIPQFIDFFVKMASLLDIDFLLLLGTILNSFQLDLN